MREEKLIEQSKRGDERAFALLMKKYEEKIRKLCFSIVKDEQSAEDITQEVFLHAFQKMSTFEGRAQFYTWLYRIAHNASLNFLKKRKRLKESELKEELSKAPAKESVEEIEIEEALFKAMNFLSPKQRVVFELYILHKLSQKNIAEVLHVPEGTIRSRLHYARQKIKEQFLQEG